MRTFVSPLADRRLLPEGGTRLTPWLIAVLMFVSVLVGAGGLAVANAAATVARSAEQRWSVQLPGGVRQAPALVAALRRLPGVTEVHATPEAEVRSLLAQWLGPEAAAADLPVPALIDVELAGGTDPVALRRQVAAVAPAARVQSFPEQLGPLLGGLRTLQWLALALLLLMAAGMAAAVILATRGAFDTHRSTVSVLHGIGATDEQLAALFQRRMAREALIGGSAGAIVALGVVLLLLSGVGPGVGLAAGGPPLRPLDLVKLGALPLATGVLALLVARITVLRALRADP